ncbi:MAG: mannitol dehydrogenase family protein, partial [Janthinobacterium lividum]
TLLVRFANPTLKDQVARICLDGSSKFPKFLLPSVHEALASGRPSKLLTLAVAGWLRYLSGKDESGHLFTVDDPRASELVALAQVGGTDPRPLLRTDIFGDLGQSEIFVRQVSDDLKQLYEEGARKTVADALA